MSQWCCGGLYKQHVVGQQHWSLTGDLALSTARLQSWLTSVREHRPVRASTDPTQPSLWLQQHLCLSPSTDTDFYLFTLAVERKSPYKPKFFNIWTDIVLGIIKVYLIENYSQKFVQCSICQPLAVTDIRCFVIQQPQQIISMCSLPKLQCFKTIHSEMHYILSKMF